MIDRAEVVVSRWATSRTKRRLDVASVVVVAVPAAVVTAAASIALFISDGPGVLMRLPRAGHGGRIFTLWKVRTRDSRLGSVLRRAGLDELPQLWNVARGDMTLIGPRPLTPAFVDRYTATDRARLEVRPGLTGWAQVHGRAATTWEESFAFDVWYVQHASPRVDLHIVGRTVTGALRRFRIGDPHAVKPDLAPSPAGVAPS